MAFASGYFKTSYAADLEIVETRARWFGLIALFLVLIIVPFVGSAFLVDLVNQVFLALIASIALMILTGFAGQISLGHAGFLAAGAFTTGILFKEFGLPFWVTVPASGMVGGVLGVIFGLPSLRLKGLYLALSTLSLHFIVVYAGSEYETKRGFSTGIVLDPPKLGDMALQDPSAWYFALLVSAVVVAIFSVNLVRSRTGRAWMAIRDRDVAAASFGIKVSRYKLYAFVVSSVLTSVAGSLFAYYRGFVSVEAFSMFLTIQYIAMVIIGGLGSILGAILGTVFVVLLPYGIDEVVEVLSIPSRFSTYMFAIKQSCFGLIMILFLVLEPTGLVGVWRRIRDYFILWPFKYRTLGG